MRGNGFNTWFSGLGPPSHTQWCYLSQNQGFNFHTRWGEATFLPLLASVLFINQKKRNIHIEEHPAPIRSALGNLLSIPGSADVNIAILRLCVYFSIQCSRM